MRPAKGLNHNKNVATRIPLCGAPKKTPIYLLKKSLDLCNPGFISIYLFGIIYTVIQRLIWTESFAEKLNMEFSEL